jgi:phospholipase/carboxylesterase
MHKKDIVTAGVELKDAKKVLIMIHGRGGSPEDILGLSRHLKVKNFALFAPRAAGNSWYPYSFLAPRIQNEPGLSSALDLIKDLVEELAVTVARENIYFCGFSQGACLMLDFLARNPARYGGAVAFSGGLVGEAIDEGDYNGDLQGMPIFIGSSDPDSHIPVDRVRTSTKVLIQLNGKVTEKIYPGMGHTISQDEIDTANDLVFTSVVPAV